MPTRVPERLFHGTLDALILQALTGGARHGYDIASWLETTSADAFSIEDAALYTALHKMEERGWIEAEWGLSPRKKRAKFYRLTRAGRGQLQKEAREWDRTTEIIARFFSKQSPS